MDDRTSTQAITESVLANKDLLPSKQTWNWYNIFAFWMSDVHSAGGYIFAGTLFSLGLAGWQVFVSLIVGIVIIQGLANIIGVPSQKLAVPFPVISRMTYGVFGANIPALIRGGIAVVWYGIQTYLASAALMIVVLYEWPDLVSLTHDNILGLSTLGWYCFAAMWVLQTALFLCNMEAIRRFMDWAGPIVYIAMLVLMVLIVREAAWENISFSLTEKEMGVSETIWTMIVGAALVVSYFCGPTLNFGDFSRYAKSPSQMKRGNFWGLPVNFVFFSLIAVVTISGTPVVFGELIVDPIEVMGKLDNKTAVLILGLTMLIATVGVNIVANFVSAAFDISNIFPKYISWRTGGLVASVLSVALLPWNLFSSPEVIHVTVDVLAALIGPVYGILIIDYYYIKRRHVVVHDLYSTSREGSYWYRHGVNWKAVAALIPAGIASVAAMMLDSGSGIGNFTFFIGAFIAAGVYRWIANSDIIRD
ncbi:NCS1 family nucleobase:cation symporter-1 [Sutterella seckii]|uniref:NCS1 family nucleobase:cation symporter-1 n=1 Tax=Sutterella seckii TaxID=1944635 RepID=A0A6I1EQ48_9BURK|nr:NCS1 family nucleobase:cation symporter-1 [Sutterella seckii]KAB7654771.1 NCS1 family nucleobase:cation symporter-1 [Sutterella seckii]MBS5217949.1 NCS1 family nucleobase:cation symporter-1 [Sutterella wadsworthensis]